MTTRKEFAIALLAGAALPRLAWAHALLLKTSPPRRAVLRDAPKQVELWFNERLEPAYSTVTLAAQNGAALKTERASVGEGDARHLSLPLPALAPGSYTVRFRVLSVDGHVAEDSFTFVVRGQ